MDPQIETLLSEVPAGFTPTFEAKTEDERIVGTLDQLDADTQRAVIGVHYFLEQGKALGEAHKLEHQQEGFVPDDDACQRNHDAVAAIYEKISALQQAAGPKLFETFAFEPGEQVAFRTEGVAASLPQDPFLAMLQRLSESGVGVQVIGVGPEGLTDLTPPTAESTPRPKRSILDRVRGQ